MKIKSKRSIKLDEPVPVYDVINAEPYHNFAVKTDTDDKVIFVSNCLERMQSRFMVNGHVAGKLFLVSSKKSEDDWLENFIQRKKDDPNVFIADAKIWEVKPSGTYSGKTFSVAIGGRNLPSKIVEEQFINIYDQYGNKKQLKPLDKVILENGIIKYAKDIEAGDAIEVADL